MPLFMCLAIRFITREHGQLSADLSSLVTGIGFILSLLVFFSMKEDIHSYFPWIVVQGLDVSIGVEINRLSVLMLMIVTGVSTAVFYFSRVYMRDDPDLSRFYSALNLFVFSMLGIVVADNLLQMFLFWELVGVSSFLLIGFWFYKPSAANACRKAFIVNRIGDFGFLLGIILVWHNTGDISFSKLESFFHSFDPEQFSSWLVPAGLLLFCGAMGKSAQFPLHVWLPDAMEGPTPVSALIHAATMVAAGVFMLCKISFMLVGSALDVIAWIGAITSLVAALIALQQDDIKRILAYSTLSQLGYMVMAVGLSAPTAAMFHLTTHAFFKALLFLGAGAIIFSVHHEQNIWKMGGLRQSMPLTYRLFLVGTLALCGIFPLSGFYSKDAIIAAAQSGNPILFFISLLVVFLTAFYMFRLVSVVFFNKPRTENASHAHEAPTGMIIPLVILAVPSVMAGWINIEEFFGTIFHHAGGANLFLLPFEHSPLPAFLGLFIAFLGAVLAFQIYSKVDEDPVVEKAGFISWVLGGKFFIDEIYRVLIACTHELLAKIAAWFDRAFLAGLVIKGSQGVIEFGGRALRLLQTGNLQTYALWFFIGLSVLLYFITH
ncbi:MAG: NADH-quinone oxidoreductase subunit L [Verrucomicrobia bacterium]|nr:NADH-quinone oxidoreductase subunit L [Verrucomicrobiota bacterium]